MPLGGLSGNPVVVSGPDKGSFKPRLSSALRTAASPAAMESGLLGGACHQEKSAPGSLLMHSHLMQV